MQTLEERFWAKVNKTDGCWEWVGRKSPKGYGEIDGTNYTVRAHRLSWELHYGPIPEGKLICHHCDNPPCVRPDHLFVGTIGDNNRDMCAKGRLVSGFMRGYAPKAKLTSEQVLSIRQVYAKGNVTMRELGQAYKVHHTTIVYIINRKHWSNI